MIEYIKNPNYEFIDDEKSVVILEPEMNKIYSMDMIGLKVLEEFNTPLALSDVETVLKNTFNNIKTEELTELLHWLVENKIIVQKENH